MFKNISFLPQTHFIKTDEIHIWLVKLSISHFTYNYFINLLSKEEALKSTQFRFENDRFEFVASHGYLRIILSQYLGCSSHAIDYEIDTFGKPFLKNQTNFSKIQFNMSHSHGIAAYILSNDTEVGIDIELIKNDYNITNSYMLEQVFTKNEIETFNKIKRKDKLKVFYEIWTLKEAFLKATGEGLTFPLNQIEVDLSQSDSPKLLNEDGSYKIASLWSLHSLKYLGNYVCAVAVKRKKENYKIIQFPQKFSE